MAELSFRLVCWNLHGVPVFTERRAERMRAAAARIVGLEPPADIVLFQEVFWPADADMLEQHMGSRYRRVDGVPRRAFPPWFLPLLDLAGIFLKFRASGLLAFVGRGWEVEKVTFEHFKAEASDFKFWEGDGYADKGIQRIDIVRPTCGCKLVVLNTHLQALRPYRAIRAAQADQLAAMVHRMGEEVPVLIAGDFNVAPVDPLYRVMTEHFRWRDLTAGLPACAGRGATESGLSRRRDYIFAAPGAGAEWSVELGILCNFMKDLPYSDHDGIDARISLAAPTAALPLRALAAGVLIGPSSRRVWLLAAGTLAADWIVRRGALGRAW